MAHNMISNLKVGDKYTDVFLVKNHAIKQTQKGSDYLDIVVVDRSGEISGKWWNIVGFDCNNMVDSDFILLQYQVEDYQGNKQLRILSVKNVAPGTQFDMSDIVPTAPENPEDMYNEIYNTAMNFKNIELKTLVTNIYTERKELMLKLPAAKSIHHAVIGGLLLHTVEMVRTAKALVSVFANLDAELLLAGAMLHDICKIDEFVTGPIGIVTDYTARGKLQGHLHMGAAYVENKCRELNLSPEVELLLSHMILSHHGEPEYGSSVRPSFVEAYLLHEIDNIDAKVYMFNEVTKDMENGTFSQKQFALDNVQVYKHDLNAYNNPTNEVVDINNPYDNSFFDDNESLF